MRTTYKVIITIMIILLTGLTFIMAIAVGASSHSIPYSTRLFFQYLFFTALLIGLIGIFIIWFRLDKIIKKRKTK